MELQCFRVYQYKIYKAIIAENLIYFTSKIYYKRTYKITFIVKLANFKIISFCNLYCYLHIFIYKTH